MTYLFGESFVYRLNTQTGFNQVVQLKTDLINGRTDSHANAAQDFNDYLRTLDPPPKMFELIYVPYGGTYDPKIQEIIKGVHPTILLKWIERPLLRQNLNWLMWETDDKGNKLRELGYYFYISKI